MLASLGLPLRQHCQFLTLEFFVRKKKQIFLEGIGKKADCCHWLIISFLKSLTFKK